MARAWIEVIDPVTQRKVDVVVGFHSDWESLEGDKVTNAHVDRIAAEVLTRLTGDRDGHPGFDLSDLEPAGS